MGSLVREIGAKEYEVVKPALDDSGYVLHMEQSGGDQGKVILTAASNLKVWGIAMTDTVPGEGQSAAANVEVAIQRHGVAMVKLLSTNAAIVKGDLLVAVPGGLCDLYVDDAVMATLPDVDQWRQDMGHIVGEALEDVAMNTGGKIKVRLQIRTLESQES
jgi:hypothetical protein